MKAWLLQQGSGEPKKGSKADAVDGSGSHLPASQPSKPAPGHRIFPYLLKGVEVNRVDQVWAADITYIPMAKGFLYRHHGLAQPARAGLEALQHHGHQLLRGLEEALGKGRPEIFNTDQGSQFTSEAFTQTLQEQRVQVSVGTWTTSSWSGCGGASSTRRCI